MKFGQEKLGQIEKRNLTIVNNISSKLTDQDYLGEKLKNEQKKLYSIMQYAKLEVGYKAFIHEYFGLPYGNKT